MKNPPRGDEGAGEAQRAAGMKSIALGNPCPQSDDCASWKELPGERAECRRCYQVFDRATMAAIFAGRA
jgi:hypothetical protein